MKSESVGFGNAPSAHWQVGAPKRRRRFSKLVVSKFCSVGFADGPSLSF